jgi:hypothetical protein
MSGTGVSGVAPGTEGRHGQPAPLWADMVSIFAGVILLIIAGFQVLQGLAAIANDDVFATTGEYIFNFDVTAWGWTHLILGILCALVAIGILVGTSWGQVAGMIVAGLAALANFAFLPYYPFWALTVIAFSLVVIWALCTQLGHDE